MKQIQGALRSKSNTLLLELDLTHGVSEAAPTEPLGQALSRKRTVLADIVLGLERAAGDPSVKALVARVGNPIALAHAQEIREAVKNFASSGKPTFAWAASFGELSSGTVPYYLASAFDQIWIQPSGDVCLTGLVLQATFVRDLLDKLGILPQIAQRWEYKNAANMFMEQHMTDAHREATQALVSSLGDQLVLGISEGRKLEATRVQELVDIGVHSGAQSLERGLVDAVGYVDEMYEHARSGFEDKPTLRFVSRYVHQQQRQQRMFDVARRVVRKSRPVLAVVHAEGTIRQGQSGRGPLGSAMGSDTIQAALRQVTADEAVKAVVLRIDSRGGSYVASDSIWRAASLLKEAGKPLIVSMGNFAASGGYFIALPGHQIVAQAGTITGSIGVLGGKQVIETALQRFGIGSEAVSQGTHSDMFSPRRPFDHSEWEMLQEWLDRVYEDFKARVAGARNMSAAEVHEVARGRVWSGYQAKERGLVDKIGGLSDAIAIAAQQSGMRKSYFELAQYPKSSLLEHLRQPNSSESPAHSSLADRIGELTDYSQVAAQLGLAPGGLLSLESIFGQI